MSEEQFSVCLILTDEKIAFYDFCCSKKYKDWTNVYIYFETSGLIFPHDYVYVSNTHYGWNLISISSYNVRHVHFHNNNVTNTRNLE